MGFFRAPTAVPLLFFLLLPRPSLSGLQSTTISPGFNGTQLNWVDKHGLFLLSPSSTFAFGFLSSPSDTWRFFLGVTHQPSDTRVWIANRDSPVTTNERLFFSKEGEVYLLGPNGSPVWSTNTSGKGATVMKLGDDGNLVLIGANNSTLWQSFDHPTDTLLPGQKFTEGMKLVSEPNARNLTFHLAIDSGDMVLRAEFRSPQPYWSIWKENRRTDQVSTGKRDVSTASIVANSWYFYDSERNPLTQVVISLKSLDGRGGSNATWAAVLGKEGSISLKALDGGGPNGMQFPELPCDLPERCDPYHSCGGKEDAISCVCPEALSTLRSVHNCDPSGAVAASCEDRSMDMDLVEVKNVSYFALAYATPTSQDSKLESCKASCKHNCSCAALFFSSRGCFLFDEIGSLQRKSSSESKSSAHPICYLKISRSPTTKEGGGGSKTITIVVVISVLTFFAVVGILYVAVRWWRRAPSSESRRKLFAPEFSGDKGGDGDEMDDDEEEEKDLMGTTSGRPMRYSYAELQQATADFSEKLGMGGFGCVYMGTLPDGKRVAVKKLEGVGQGRKEFRAEVCIIGSIHHHHLVRLRGFCAEGPHRLLAYEYMAHGSLDRWLFRRHGEAALDFDTRYSIALGTAKGLAYLHEDCESKIVHCDVKPENVLLDEKFSAKVSDFGLAKLMTREQSQVFTTLRGTRGYLAPEWIISSAISEKSDVYSYGMVLLEIVGGRKSFDSRLSSDKAHLPTYAFKMMEEGRSLEVLDEELRGKDNLDDERVKVALKVALWCIQEDVSLRPSMGKVVQMLEGVTEVPQPPLSSQLGYRLYANVLKCIGEGGTTTSSSAPSDCNSDALLSAVRLSGPR